MRPINAPTARPVVSTPTPSPTPPTPATTPDKTSATPYFQADRWDQARTLTARNHGVQPDSGPNFTTTHTLGQGNWAATASALRADGQWSNGPFSASGSAAIGQVNADANAQLSTDFARGTVNASVGADASAYLATASGQAAANYQVLGLDSSTAANGYANVGVSATGTAQVTVDPLHGTADAEVNANAFAGVQAGGAINETVGPANGSVGGKVEAGIGAQFDASAGIKNGKVGFTLNMGAALGVGADLNFSGNVDVAAIGRDAGHIGSDLGHGLASAASAVGNFFS